MGSRSTAKTPAVTANAAEKEKLWRSWFPRVQFKSRGMTDADTDQLLEAFSLFCMSVKIRHPEFGKIPFKLREAQRETVRLWIKEQKVVNLKARQIGFSTLAAVFMLWIALGWNDKQILALSKGEREAIKLLLKSKLAYRTLPEWARERAPKLTNRVATSMAFDNDSVIESLPSNAGRGESAFLVIVDEWAFVNDPDSAWANIEPTADVGGRVIGLSTANGEGDFFHRLWLQAREGINGFTPVFWPWSAHEDRDQAWHDSKKLELPQWQLSQEYPSDEFEAFIGSGNPVFNLDVLNSKQPTDPLRAVWIDSHRPKQFSIREGGDLLIFEEPQTNEVYCVGADTAQGLMHGDYTVCTVQKVSDGNIVAVFRSRIDPDILGEKVLPGIGYFYNTAVIGPEINNHGMTTLKGLQRSKYPLLFRRRTQAKRTEAQTESLGWYTSHANKGAMIDEVAKWLRDHPVPYATMLAELKGYTRDKNGRMTGSPHDDTVMSLAVSLQVLQYCHQNPVRSQLPAEYGNSLEYWDKQLSKANAQNRHGNHPNRSRSRRSRTTVLSVGRSFSF